MYYSHTLKLLFFSFMHGKNFVGHLDSSLSELHNLVVIPFKPLTSSKQSGSGSGSQSAQHTLVQWSEVYGHPGLVSSVCQASNNPVVLLIKPDSIWLQEVEVAKLKVQDFVLTRHSFHHADDASDTSVDHRVGLFHPSHPSPLSYPLFFHHPPINHFLSLHLLIAHSLTLLYHAPPPPQVTSMVVLCADGSMRILNADAALTDQWVNMTSCLPPVSSSATLTSSFTSKPPKKRTKQSSESGTLSMPSPFFSLFFFFLFFLLFFPFFLSFLPFFLLFFSFFFFLLFFHSIFSSLLPPLPLLLFFILFHCFHYGHHLQSQPTSSNSQEPDRTKFNSCRLL